MTIKEVLDKIKDQKIRVVIFDFDNTICDMVMDWTLWYEGMQAIFKSFDPSFIDTLHEGNSAELQNKFIKKYGEPLREKVNEFTRDYELTYAKGCKALDRILSLINNLSEVKLWIWSSNARETVEKYLDELGIKQRFSKFITRDSADFLKPNPSGFTKSILSDADLSTYLMIGNSKNDRKAAGLAGISYIDVSKIDL